MENLNLVLAVLLAGTALLGIWNLRLSARAGRERESLRQSLERLEAKLAEMSGAARGNPEAESAAAEGRKEIRAEQAKTASSVGEILAGLGRLKESLSALQASQQESFQSAASAREKTAEGERAGREEAARALSSVPEKMREEFETLRRDLAAQRETAGKAQGDAATKEMEAALEALLRRFEKRVAEYLEENSLKVQEILLEALERFPEEATATRILARVEEGREKHDG